jgi:hypothetical protein
VALGHLHVDLVVEILEDLQIVDDAKPLVEPHEHGQIGGLDGRQIALFHPPAVVLRVFSFQAHMLNVSVAV